MGPGVTKCHRQRTTSSDFAVILYMDPEQNVFRFAHQSVREYLLSRPEYMVVEQHALATERCLDVYLDESWPGSITPKMVQLNNVLEPYAKVYWPVHLKNVEDCESSELRNKIRRFIKQDSKASSSYLHWASDISSHYEDCNIQSFHESLGLNYDDPLRHRLQCSTFEPATHLSTACAFGLLSLLKGCQLSSSDCNLRQDSQWGRIVHEKGYTLLMIAAGEGHDQVVQMLLERGANINAKGGRYGSAL